MRDIIEIKATCAEPERVRQILENEQADFHGVDHQIDTYFFSPKGRLKLRQGNIENNLIFYQRPNGSAPKHSQVLLYAPHDTAVLHELLTNALPVRVVVDKKRDIYFIENVKFHIDRVLGLGSFVEIEAIAETEEHTLPFLRQQCVHYRELLGINRHDLLAQSYSDLLLAQMDEV